MAGTFEKYEIEWRANTSDAFIERHMIRNGGQWEEGGKMFGNGLIFHFKKYWEYLWPMDDQTWWTDLLLKEILENQFTSVVGGASAWKTGTVARIALMDWSCFPECTTVITSSTTLEGLKARVFGEMTMLWKKAHEITGGEEGWFPGHSVDSKCVITHDDVQIVQARDIRNSIVGVACKTSSGKFIGMGSYAGRKNRRVWCVGDEFQFMEVSIMDGQKNLVSNGPNLVPAIIRDKNNKENGLPQRGYKCVFIGNTNPSRPGNPLDVVSEPEKGWGSIPDDGKTKVWKCKQLPDHPIKCTCINLDAMDSPNSDYPIDKPRWVHLAGPHKLALYRDGSESYWSQGRGVFKFGLAEFKFITRQICEQHHALDPVVWLSTGQTKIGMLDAAYGAGDRCALGWLEFGVCLDGKVRLLFREMWLVPIIIRPDMKPEDQIAHFCKNKMESVGVLPENFFFDGRGSMAMSLASVWSPKVNALEFGGVPSERPAGPDIFINDPKIGRRLKTEREHFSKKVTALWWGWKYVIEADQMRGLTEEIIADATPREWYYVANNKIEAETKAEMKKRTGLSPDLADMMVTGVEGARQRGFEILKLSIATTKPEDDEYFDKEATAWDKALKSGLLKY